MILTCLQPSFAPNLYYLAALKKADCIVIQNEAIWSRKGKSHRFQIRTKDDTLWLTIPIKTEDKKKPISKVRIDHQSDQLWLTKWERTLDSAYKNSIYYEHFELEIKSDFEQISEMEFLLDAIQFMNRQLFTYLEFSIDANALQCGEAFSSYLNPYELVNLFKPNTVYQEENGEQFQWIHEMAEPSLHDYPTYKQHFSGFIPGLSIFDLLFEVGPESFKIFDSF
ncbi:hypothetical protein EP331_06650 [bacterium]|nr:MAG: hypothetical protein EP331_06650 [bacterium]